MKPRKMGVWYFGIGLVDHEATFEDLYRVFFYFYKLTSPVPPAYMLQKKHYKGVIWQKSFRLRLPNFRVEI